MNENKTTKAFSKREYHATKIIFSLLLLLLIIPTVINLQTSTYFFTSPTSASRALFVKWKGIALNATNALGHSENTYATAWVSKLRDSVTYLPLKDLRFADTPMEGNTWFMSSLNDTHEENEAEYLYFPSQASKGRLLCMKGRDSRDGMKNSYALAWPEALPDSAKLIKGLTFVSDTYYDYQNLWHGLTAMVPFVGWSMKNECVRPTRWILFHWGEMRLKVGSWLQHLMRANFGDFRIETFEDGDGPYCFEKAVVIRHNEGSMGKEKKLQVSDQLRCQARRFCGIDPAGKGEEVNEKGEPVIRLTLLMRRGARAFKNPTAVADIFSRECDKVEGCILKVVQSEDLSFCDQVREMTYTDVVASPHGAQLTNMLFMNRNSSVMEFFPKGWLELAGIGQYAHHWMADQSGMNHQGAWWEPLGKYECPSPENELDCFNFYKSGQVGHNETHFADWARTVLNEARTNKLESAKRSSFNKPHSSACSC
ncbi:hypothetical protein Tsubulata_038714 [Turnera subulata]|uniref:Glycosyltransferase 61 catalytic domain-containing protein n=1 Tax=Turnera subulata TaxID=218843 RepID=A0A9Q0FLX5_9ROSI|nr:hypothetical protein Tsubulata_038714 [Turnera subulata]